MTDRLLLRRRSVDEAAIYRQLWTERDPRVPPHRRISSEGRPAVADIAAEIRAVVAWVEASGYRRLWASVRDWNAASRRVLEKLDFRETGEMEPDAVHGDSLLTVREF